MYKTSEKTGIAVSVRDIFWYMLCSWRVLLIWLIVGAVVLGAYSGYKSYKASGSAGLEEQATAIMAGMSEADMATARNYSSAYVHYLEMYEYYAEYTEKSVFEKLDSSDARVKTLTYLISADDGSDADISGITSAYRTNIINDSFAQDVADAWNISVDEAFYYYDGVVRVGDESSLLDSNNYANVYVSNLDSANTALIISIYGENDEFVEKMADVVKKSVEDLKETIENGTAEYTMTLAAEYIGKANDTYIYDRQEEYAKNAMDILNSGSYLSENLTGLMPTVVAYLVSQSYDGPYFSLAFPGVSLEGGKASVSISFIWVIIGAIIGVIAAILVMLIKYLGKAVIRSYSDIEYTYGVSVLGTMADPAAGAKRHKSRLDKWLWTRRMGHRIQTLEDAAALAAAKIALMAQNAGVRNVCIAAGEDVLDADKLTAEIVKQAETDGTVQITAAMDLLKKAEASKAVKESQAVVLLEQIDRTKFSHMDETLILLGNGDIKVLGAIVAE